MSDSFQSIETVFIALGSNLGDSVRIVGRAMDRLESLSTRPLAKSSLWESSPVDCPPGSPHFINAVVALAPHRNESPETLLDQLQAIEREFGRQPKTVRNEARPLDLDIIAFGNRALSSARLALPHPRAHLRAFVLAPLNEIAPELILRGQTTTVSQLILDLPTSAGILVRKLHSMPSI